MSEVEEKIDVVEINLFSYLYDIIRSKIHMWFFGRKIRKMSTESLIELLGELRCKCTCCGKNEQYNG
jgi:hypothetical protein